MCEHCRHGEDGMFRLSDACPQRFRLIAHRLRAGYGPAMDYEPEPKADTARQSVYREYKVSCKAMKKQDREEGGITEGVDTPPGSGILNAQTTSVREQHTIKAAKTGEVPKGRVSQDCTG